MLQVEKYKSGIKIKKSNRGKFTSYCGGNVTSACILRGKHSSNPAIRKRATFAANARKWKHLFGGTFIVPLDNTRVALLPRPSRIVRRLPVRLQAEFKPWTYSDLLASNRRKELAQRAQLYRNTYHMWLVDPTRPYPRTDLEMIGEFNYAGRTGEPIREALALATGAGAIRLLPRAGRAIATGLRNEGKALGQSLTTLTGRQMWGLASRDLLNYMNPLNIKLWKLPNAGATGNFIAGLGKSEIMGSTYGLAIDAAVLGALNKPIDGSYSKEEMQLKLLVANDSVATWFEDFDDDSYYTIE